jgi:putative transposase
MYEYRKLTPEQRAELVRERQARGFPPHAPPHPAQDQSFYLLTAACYEHASHMFFSDRRRQVLNALFEHFIAHGMEIRAWVVLPNHYHLLVHIMDFDELSGIFRLVHGPTSRQWNLEDASPGRKVWFTFTDRQIRSERHYYTTLNYIHYNPVKHRWTSSPYEWEESSVHWYLEHLGREWLRDLWTSYPMRNYGRGWDDGPGLARR